MGVIFGTDGARGVANSEITCELAMNIGRAAAVVLTENIHKRPKVLIGKDTRVSSDMLEGAIKAGLCSVGADVIILGIIPTPAVAYLVRKYEADAGIMISASHNPYKFNGIKIFNKDGYKLPDSLEQKIEEILLNNMSGVRYPEGVDIGSVKYMDSASEDYVSYIKSTIPGRISGIKLAIDCSNGSASVTANKLFDNLGVDCKILYNSPDGVNINENCGSTSLESLSEFVVENHMDLGIAFDGDADRCLAVDENGQEVDGDHIMAICALDMKERKKLVNNAVVGTIMTNMGFTEFCKKNSIKFEASKVGDRYVLEKMKKNGYNFGGEQSGHIIFHDYASTGDGQITAVQLLHVLSSKEKTLSELAKIVTKYPQVVVNVEINPKSKSQLESSQEVNDAILQARKELEGIGRIVVRESGTESLVRVMVECIDVKKMNSIAEMVSKKISELLG